MNRSRGPIILAALAVLSLGAGAANAAAPSAGAPRPSATHRVPTTAAPATTVGPTTTVAPEPPRIPLTGVPLEFGQVAPDRAAMVVKIDNADRARPQSGLNQADIVFEEIVEGDFTRFAAVFHSQGANPVGPIRSGRTQDIDLLGGLVNPIFVWSGGNGRVVAAMQSSGFVLVNATGGGCCFYRSRDRSAPHNLYNNTDALWEAYAGVAPGRPAPVFSYVAPGDAVPGLPASAAELMMGGTRVRWEWAPETDVYHRRQNGREHPLTDGPATADNVVILEVGYRPSAADANSPEAITLGGGSAWVLSDGTVQLGTWTRAASTDPFTLVTDDGTPIVLGPGRTWVELSRAGDNAVGIS